MAKKIAAAQGVKDFNILQNNGRLAHQVLSTFSELECNPWLNQCNRKLTTSISMLSQSLTRPKGSVSNGQRRSPRKKSWRKYSKISKVACKSFVRRFAEDQWPPCILPSFWTRISALKNAQWVLAREVLRSLSLLSSLCRLSTSKLVGNWLSLHAQHPDT